MSRELIRSSAFLRAARRFAKKNPHCVEELRLALNRLSENPFHPTLKTHKLKGRLDGSWACRAGYDLRIIFKFVQQEGEQAILLQTMEAHDEVY